MQVVQYPEHAIDDLYDPLSYPEQFSSIQVPNSIDQEFFEDQQELIR